MTRRTILLGAAVLLAASLAPASLAGQRGAGVGGAADAARAFYRYHFSHGFCYAGACLTRRRAWLTAELYGLLRYERQRRLPPDTVPYLDGDPFTNSQEYPQTFRVGRAEPHAGGARVEVSVQWLEKRNVIDRRKYSLLMEREGGAWKIADIISHEGESLRDQLRKLKREDAQPDAPSGEATRGTEAGDASVEETLIANEKRTWELYKSKDVKALAELTAEDYYDIYPSGEVVGKKRYLADVLDTEVKEYALSDFKVIMLNEAAAVVVYRGKVHGVVGKREIRSEVAVTSGWARRGGKWLNVFYRENPVEVNGRRLL